MLFIKIGNSYNEKRILGGENSPESSFKWVASIKGDISVVKKSMVYSASILKSDAGILWLITAAHCFYPSNGANFIDMTSPDLWHVAITKFDSVFEKHGLKDKAIEKLKNIIKNKLVTNDFHVKKIIIHPNYKPVRKSKDNVPVPLDNDIALIKLSEPLPANQPLLIDPLELPSYSKDFVSFENDKECIVAGWECRKKSNSESFSTKKTTVKILNKDNCEKLTSKSFLMNFQTDLCATQTIKENGFCLEDIGSGLVCDNRGKPTLTGILSRGYNDQPIQFPPVFTRVASYVNWIKDTIKNS